MRCCRTMNMIAPYRIGFVFALTVGLRPAQPHRAL
jgi:hypothetical protein